MRERGGGGGDGALTARVSAGPRRSGGALPVVPGFERRDSREEMVCEIGLKAGRLERGQLFCKEGVRAYE
jgi:hypothetical protein